MPIRYDRKVFFDGIREPVFGGTMTASQVSGTEQILDEWERLQPVGDTRFLADMLGTAKWETASTMQPIEEIGHGRGRAYGVPAGPWHKIYDGRGDVQLTWLANYRKADARLKALGVLRADEDLVKSPELAMRPDVAAAIMIHGMLEGWFTGKRLATYYTATAADWVGSRRIINGTDHAAAIAVLKKHFYVALVAASRAVVAPSPTDGVPGPGGQPAAIAVTPPSPTSSPSLGVVPAAAAAKAGIALPAGAAIARPPAPAKPGVLARLAFYFGRH